MYYSAIGILAVLILFIVNHDILFGRRVSFDKPAWKMYRRFLFVVFLYYITDILWGFFESRKMVAPLFADTTVYYIAMAAGVLYWAGFTVAYSEEKKSLRAVHPGRIQCTGRADSGAFRYQHLHTDSFYRERRLRL